MNCSAPGTDAFVKIEARSSMMYILLGMTFAIMACIAVGSAFWYYNTKLKPGIDPMGNHKPSPETTPPEVSTDYLTVFNNNDQELKDFVVNHSSSAVIVAMIFHPGCGHCTNMRSEFSKFAQQVSQSTRKEAPIRVIKYVPTNFQEVSTIFDISSESFQGVPHVIMYTRRNGQSRSSSYEFNKPYSKVHRFRTSESLNAWLDAEIPDLLKVGVNTNSSTETAKPRDEQKQALNDAVQAAATRKSPVVESSSDESDDSTDGEEDETVTQESPDQPAIVPNEPAVVPNEPAVVPNEPEPEAESNTKPKIVEKTPPETKSKKKQKKFISSENWVGHKEGYVYKQDSKGLGYYKEK